jgi:hypothetical protein
VAVARSPGPNGPIEHRDQRRSPQSFQRHRLLIVPRRCDTTSPGIPLCAGDVGPTAAGLRA